MRMCVRRTRSPENQISRCLPRASTRSIVRPRSGAVSSTRVRWEKTESKRVTVRPASAWLSVRAARKMVSPSGISKSQLPNPELQIPTYAVGFWALGFGLWDLLIGRIVTVDVREGAVRIELAFVDVAEVLALHGLVIAAIARGFLALVLHLLILIVG